MMEDSVHQPLWITQDSTVDAAADGIWDAVAVTSTMAGTERRLSKDCGPSGVVHDTT
jgi:hypothetical protein